MVFAVYDREEGLLAAFIYEDDAYDYLAQYAPKAHEVVEYDDEIVFYHDYREVV